MIAVMIPFGFDAAPGGALVGLALLAVFGVGLGSLSYALAIAVRKQDWMFWVVQQTFLFPLMILSGMLLPLETGPEWMQVAAKFNPLSYLVDAERTLFAGQIVMSAAMWGGSPRSGPRSSVSGWASPPCAAAPTDSVSGADQLPHRADELPTARTNFPTARINFPPRGSTSHRADETAEKPAASSAPADVDPRRQPVQAGRSDRMSGVAGTIAGVITRLPTPTRVLSAAEARRIAIAAEQLAAPAPKTRSTPVNRGHVSRLVRAIGPLQIDSVNVLARSHLIPVFSRLGGYPISVLESLAWPARPAVRRRRGASQEEPRSGPSAEPNNQMPTGPC